MAKTKTNLTEAQNVAQVITGTITGVSNQARKVDAELHEDFLNLVEKEYFHELIEKKKAVKEADMKRCKEDVENQKKVLGKLMQDFMDKNMGAHALEPDEASFLGFLRTAYNHLYLDDMMKDVFPGNYDIETIPSVKSSKGLSRAIVGLQKALIQLDDAPYKLQLMENDVPFKKYITPAAKAVCKELTALGVAECTICFHRMLSEIKDCGICMSESIANVTFNFKDGHRETMTIH